jgi:hypothetical protein
MPDDEKWFSERHGYERQEPAREITIREAVPEPLLEALINMEATQNLRTERGRAEVILEPGTFVRLNEGTRIEMIAADRADIQVRFHLGSILVEVREKPASSVISILSSHGSVAVDRRGAVSH